MLIYTFITMNRQLQFLKKLTVLFSVSLLLCFTGIKAQTLNPGDLAVIGWNALSNEVYFATLVDIPAGTVIKITDRGWDPATNSFSTGTASMTADGFITWTLSGNLSEGTVLKFFWGGTVTGESNVTTLFNLTTGDNLTGDIVVDGHTIADPLLATGDQVFIYQGTENNPFFIFGLNNSAGPVDADNWNNNYEVSQTFLVARDSYLPNGTGSQNALTNGVNAIGLPGGTIDGVQIQKDNVQYIGPTTTADRNTWLARITDIANWGGSDAEDSPSNPIISASPQIVDIAPPNNPPTDIALSNASVNQSAGVDAVVGTLSSTDPDEDDTHIYTLVSGAGSTNNGSFNISGATLRVNNAAAMGAGTYSVRIRSTDNKGGTYEESFTITVVDDVAPTVSSVSVPANGTYIIDQALDFTVNVSEDVTVTGIPLLPLTIGSTTVNATYESGTGTSTLLFRYTIASGDMDTDGIEAGASIDLNGGTINDGASPSHPLALTLNGVASTTGVLIDGIAPSVTSVEVPADGTYGIGEALTFIVNFNQNVTVNTGGGVPYLPLTIGSATRYATYTSGTGTSALEFAYTIIAGDNDNDGIALTTSFDFNGGTIRDAAGNSATATLNAVGPTTDILVDGLAPSVSSFSPANGSTDVAPNANLVVSFSEDIALGTGDIVVYDVGTGSPAATIDVASHGGQLSLTGNVLTINPPADLLELTDYYVTIGNDAIHDLTGNVFLGINDNSTWAFSVADVTAPTGYSVAIDQTEITLANHTSLSFTFTSAEVGATYDYEISSSEGGTPVTGNGAVTAAGQQVSGIDVSSLPNGTLSLSVTLTDAAANVGSPATDNVTKNVNHPPQLTASAGTILFFESVSGAPVPVAVDDGITVTDADDSALASAEVRITGNFQSGEDVLGFSNSGSSMGNIAGSYSSDTGVLTLGSAGATATLAQWEAALRSVTYTNTSATPNTSGRTVSFTVSDGVDDSNPATRSIAVLSVNTAPTVTLPTTITVVEDEATPLTEISFSDPDAGVGFVTVTFSVPSGTLAATSGSGVTVGGSASTLTLNGTVADINAFVSGGRVGYTTAANATADVTLTVSIDDNGNTGPGGPQQDSGTVTLTVTAVNDAPAVTTSGGATTFTESEDGDPVPQVVDPGLTVTDLDNATWASALISITSVSFQAGEDVLAFENDGNTMGNIDGSYDDATGTLMLSSLGATATLAEWQAALRAVTYSNSSQNPNTTTRTISFVVNDGTDDSSPATKDVAVIAVNTAPVAVDDPVTVSENMPAIGNVLTNDSDAEGNALTASLVTAPVNGTVVLNSDGSFTYTPNGNYNGLDSLEYQVCDNGIPSRCDAAWIHVTIGAINDAPVIIAPATLAVDEDVLTDLTGISFADVDAAGADVTVTFSVSSGMLSATTGGGVTVSGSETAILTLVGSIADLNAFIAVGNVGFTTVLDETDDVTLTVHIDDGGNTGIDPGNSGTDDSEAATETVRITVNAQNDAPVNSVPGNQSVEQNSTLVFSTVNGNALAVSDVDAESGPIRVTLAATNGLLTLSGTTGLTFVEGSGTGDGTAIFEGIISDINLALNGLTFVPASDYFGPASLQIVADDLGLTGAGGAKTDTDLISITVYQAKPLVTSVGTRSADGIYKIGDNIDLTVTFDMPVTVDKTGGVPYLLLETGDADREAVYESGSGSNILIFNYTVQAGDVNADLDYTSTAALVLNGATIQNASGDPAVLDLPAVGGATSIAGQHDVEIDGVAPEVTLVEVPVDGYYRGADVLAFTIHVSEEVTVNNTGGTPYLEVTIGKTVVHAGYTGGSGTDRLTFSYTVQPEDVDLDGIALGSEIVLGGGILHDHAGNEAIAVLNGVAPTDDVLVYSVRPSVDLSTASTSPVNGPFLVTATFSEPVTGFTVDDISVTNGTPGDFRTGDNISYTFVVTPGAGGIVQLSVAADVAVNIAANGNIASNTLSVQFNEVITGVTLEDAGFVYDGAEHALELTGDLPEGASVVYEIDGEPGNGATDVGTYEVTARIDGGGNYEDAELKATLTITPLRIAVTAEDKTKVFGADDPELTYTHTPALIGADTFAGSLDREAGEAVGEYAITRGNLSAGVNYEITFEGGSLTITPATITGVTLEDGSFVYDGTAKSLEIEGGLPKGTSVNYGNNSRTDAGSQEATATISGRGYETLTLRATLTITRAERSIDFPPLPGKTYGDGAFGSGASASSGEVLSYASSDPGVAEVSAAGLITIHGAGITTITATVPVNGNYSNRPEVSRRLVVGKSRQTIAFSEVGEVHRDAGSVELEVSASSGLPVSLSVDDPEVATVEGTALHIHRLGTVRITASQGGDGNHEPAETVTVTVRVVDPEAELPMRVSKVVSPNGDGINEYLIIEGIKDYPDNKVMVFNRNGTVLYEAKGYNNGSIAFRGISTGQQLLSAGTYFYVAEIRVNGQWKYEKGWFVLRY